MSINTVLRGCHELLKTTADEHRFNGNINHASQCDLQAEAVARLLEELAKEEETSDG